MCPELISLLDRPQRVPEDCFKLGCQILFPSVPLFINSTGSLTLCSVFSWWRDLFGSLKDTGSSTGRVEVPSPWRNKLHPCSRKRCTTRESKAQDPSSSRRLQSKISNCAVICRNLNMRIRTRWRERRIVYKPGGMSRFAEELKNKSLPKRETGGFLIPPLTKT